MDKLLNKIFRFEGGEILSGPKKGKKLSDNWMWTSFKMSNNIYYALHYTFDKKFSSQTADKDLLTNKSVHIANAEEVPEKFLRQIIRWELGK